MGKPTTIPVLEPSDKENKPSKNSVLRLIRQTDLNSTVKEKRLMQLKREENDLSKQIKLMKKQLKAKNKILQNNSVCPIKPQTATEGQQKRFGLLPRRHEVQKLQNQSLYEREKQMHFQGLRRSESMVKTLLAERKRIGIYSRQLQRNKITEEKTKAEENHKLYRALVRIKQEKLKQNDYLKYEELRLQARLRSETLQNQQKEELAKLQKLQELKQNIEREMNKKC